MFRERWHYENMSERYIYIMDDLERIAASGVPLQNLSKNFSLPQYSLGTDSCHTNLMSKEYASTTMKGCTLQCSDYSKLGTNKHHCLLKCPVVKKQLINPLKCPSVSNLLIEKNFDGGILLLSPVRLLSIRSHDFNLLQK